jgi:hypothetical protein
MLADKLRERESADCMQVITSTYRDQVIEHMSQQLSHFETLHRTCLTVSSDNSQPNRLTILHDLLQCVHLRFNFEAERLR